MDKQLKMSYEYITPYHPSSTPDPLLRTDFQWSTETIILWKGFTVCHPGFSNALRGTKPSLPQPPPRLRRVLLVGGSAKMYPMPCPRIWRRVSGSIFNTTS